MLGIRIDLRACKTYLITHGNFIPDLWSFIAVIIAAIGWLNPIPQIVAATLRSSALRVSASLGSYSVACRHPCEHLLQLAHAFASSGDAFGVYAILSAPGSSGCLLITSAVIILLSAFVPRAYAGACFHRVAICESLGAAALRIAVGIFTKIADIGPL